MIESVQDAGALSGRVALVTGAARGIGEAITRLLAARGAAVVLADRDCDLVCSVADDLAAHGADSLGVAIDITSDQAVSELAAVIGSRWGRLDVLVNNAAILDATPLEKLTRDRFEEVQRINQGGALWVTLGLLPQLRRSARGRVVNIASILGVRGAADSVAYATAITTLSLGNLLRAYAEQVQKSGWRAHPETIGDFGAVQSFEFTDADSKTWRGLLVVVDNGEDRAVLFRVNLAKAP